MKLQHLQTILAHYNIEANLTEAQLVDLNSMVDGAMVPVSLPDLKEDGPAVIIFDGVVGDDFEGLSAKTVVSFIEDIGDRDLLIKVNSPGGSAYDGMAIHNAILAREGKTVVEIVGLAASAASLFPMAADEVRIWSVAGMMIHQARTIAYGRRQTLEAVAKTLGQVDQMILNGYADKTGKGKDEIMTMLEGEGDDDGTLLTGEEAVAQGFADVLMKPEKKKPGKPANKDEASPDLRADEPEEIDATVVAEATKKATEAALTQARAELEDFTRSRLAQARAQLERTRLSLQVGPLVFEADDDFEGDE